MPDYRKRLNDLAYEMDLPAPVVTSMIEGKKTHNFLAKVKIGDRSWTSYPLSFSSKELAEAEAIQKALKGLEEKRGTGCANALIWSNWCQI